ncbi:hypothetical protein ACFUEN_28910 [Streptomyces griseorubiginosus]|uniref:hypothetical protein n=1 Tax=Streptomyces griseorubiginosus TaxID=67304 RepID=UPI003631D540
MQQHTVQQLEGGPRSGKYVYTGGNRRIGRYVECCAEPYLTVMASPAEERDACPAWQDIGHDTAADAYAHMRTVLLAKLDLGGHLADWSGCTAPVGGRICDEPTKRIARIPPMHFQEPLCDKHRTQDTVEAMWDGPGDWSGSW